MYVSTEARRIGWTLPGLRASGYCLAINMWMDEARLEGLIIFLERAKRDGSLEGFTLSELAERKRGFARRQVKTCCGCLPNEQCECEVFGLYADMTERHGQGGQQVERPQTTMAWHFGPGLAPYIPHDLPGASMRST